MNWRPFAVLNDHPKTEALGRVCGFVAADRRLLRKLHNSGWLLITRPHNTHLPWLGSIVMYAVPGSLVSINQSRVARLDSRHLFTNVLFNNPQFFAVKRQVLSGRKDLLNTDSQQPSLSDFELEF